jgi:ferritin-like metal-binding protein YciE
MAEARAKDRSGQDEDYRLENRRYRDDQGGIHYHSRKYMERQGEGSDSEGQQRRGFYGRSRQRRAGSWDGNWAFGDFARNIGNAPALLLVAAAAAGTFFLSRRIGEENISRRGFGRDRGGENFIPGTGWLRGTLLPRPETPRDVFVTGLRNAHSVEIKATQLLERQIEALSDYPDVRARMEQHLGETRAQIDRLENIFDQLDESPSTIKDTLLAAFGNALVMPQGMAGDAILKGAFASYAFENYEIAAYRSLTIMSQMVGMPQFRAPLETTLNEEMRMAQWLGDHIQAVTRRYMSEVKAEEVKSES